MPCGYGSGSYTLAGGHGGAFAGKRLGDATNIEAFQSLVKPYSVVGLIATVMILFGLQGQVIVSTPFVIVLIAVPIILQSYGIFAIAYAAAFALKVPHRIAAPCALIGTSNFFELAVAVAISLFGLNSGAALATVVGVLVEVPVMLTLVTFVNLTRARFYHHTSTFLSSICICIPDLITKFLTTWLKCRVI